MGQAFASLVLPSSTTPKVTKFDTLREGKMRAIGGFQASYRHGAEH
jgi:hypothetical protein